MKNKAKQSEQQLRSRYFQVITPDGLVMSTISVKVRSRSEVRARASEWISAYSRHQAGFSYRIPPQ